MVDLGSVQIDEHTIVNTLPVASALYSRLDWFTAVFERISLNEILGIFHKECTVDLMEVFSQAYVSSKGYGSDFTLNCDGLNIKVDIISCWENFHCDVDELPTIDPMLFFSTKFNHIRVDISGSALTNLDANGFNMSNFYSPFVLPEGADYHVTRADFAFDFLNCHSDILDSLIDFCTLESSSGTVKIDTCKRPVKYSVRVGGEQKTVYLGSPRSDKMLRVYDKFLESQVKAGGIKSSIYGNEDFEISSWIRVELQSRNEIAQQLLYGFQGEWCNLWRYVYDSFAPVTKDGSILPAWLNSVVLTGSEIFVQNNNFVANEDSLERAERFIRNTAFRSLCIFVAHHGFDQLNEEIRFLFDKLQRDDDPLSKRRFLALRLSFGRIDERLPNYVVKDNNLYKFI